MAVPFGSPQDSKQRSAASIPTASEANPPAAFISSRKAICAVVDLPPGALSSSA
jgi:hypothetical protein